MEKVFFNDEFNKTLKSDGWHRITAGSTRDINYDDRCAFFVKRTKIAEILKTPASKTSKRPAKSRDSGTPPKTVMVNSRDGGGCSSSSVAPISSYTNALTDFE